VECAGGDPCRHVLHRRLGAEADGREYHLSAKDWERDLRRQNAVHGQGIRLLRFPVRRLRWEEDACGSEIWTAYRQAE
jgi:very-short-patch-repair endonuclease